MIEATFYALQLRSIGMNLKQVVERKMVLARTNAVKPEDYYLIRHFFENSDEMEPERVALMSGLIEEVTVFLEIGADPITRGTRVFRKEA